MAQLKFYYGTMGSGKTTDLLKKYTLYKKLGKNPLIVKPTIDNRDGNFIGWGKIKSRVIDNGDDAYYFKNLSKDVLPLNFDTLFIDEVQFLSKTDIQILEMIVQYTDRDVICYGLEKDINNNIFDGSLHLMEKADYKCEIKRKCQIDGCDFYASNHLRYIDGKLDFNNDVVLIEKGNITYKSVCYKHWMKLKQHER